jgi:ribosomal subunit interface protein
MNIRVIDGSIQTTPGMVAHIRARLNNALDRFSRHVRDVEIHIKDDNGPKGGVDKRCSIHAHIDGSAPIIVEHRDSEFYAAIDQASHKLKRAVTRFFDRRRDR